ncbi:MAG: hydantoinase B/oxoprolinase family protein [Nitrospirae bacterium]|nr:MAG: hydantoinase B/oxoprolinase family protein [Nitrospirota bacterium]
MTDPIRTELIKHRLASIAEEMGVRLQRAAYSPNIKERRDFSCAVFDACGRLVAQAAHIPVHLGAMPLSVQACLQAHTLMPGDVMIVNDPYHGGTHLPDITLVSPVFDDEREPASLLGFVANRAHHADIGGMTPGSMPLSQEVYQEGLIVPPVKLVQGGVLNEQLWTLLLANVRTPVERAGDLRAQLAANRTGQSRLQALADRIGCARLREDMDEVLRYSERLTRRLLATLPEGVYRFEDVMDDDGIEDEPARIAVTLHLRGDEALVDFSGTARQRRGCINAVYPITLAATAYVFRCVLGMDVPANSGCMVPITVQAPEGSLVHAKPPAAVVGGNVETAQRIVDVLLGAFAQACPDRIPAASQGTMNNVAIGGWDPLREQPFAYYETIGGGAGASPTAPGTSAIQTHMTNTMNTPIEALEYAYPLRVHRYALRPNSGGSGRWTGGDGICRELVFLCPATVTILSDRRTRGPYGLAGGGSGQPGRNRLVCSDGTIRELPGKCQLSVDAGNVLVIETPGGGGYGSLE